MESNARTPTLVPWENPGPYFCPCFFLTTLTSDDLPFLLLQNLLGKEAEQLEMPRLSSRHWLFSHPLCDLGQVFFCFFQSSMSLNGLFNFNNLVWEHSEGRSELIFKLLIPSPLVKRENS